MTGTDVAVCGAGPAGAALAALLADGGLDVVVVEAQPTPGDVVGESLLPFGNRVLQRLGVQMDGFQQKDGAIFTRGDDATRIAFAEASRPLWTHAHQVKRADFDLRLRSAAEARGVRFLTARVQRFEPPCVHTSRGVVRADLVVDALGRRGALSTQLGIRDQHPVLRNAARSAWFEGVQAFEPERPGDIVIASFDGGWFWIIPFADGTHSVGAVTTRESGLRGDFHGALERCTAVQRRLAKARPIGPMRGHQDFTASSRAFSGDGWALVGDAAIFVDPLFSSGVLLGLECADGLARAILGQDSFEAWEARIRRASKAFELAALAFYDRSFLRVLFSPPEQHSQRIRSDIIGLLAGDVFEEASAGPIKMASRLGTIARFLDTRLPTSDA